MHILNDIEDLYNLIDAVILEGRPLNYETKQDIMYFIMQMKYTRGVESWNIELVWYSNLLQVQLKSDLHLDTMETDIGILLK